MNYLSASAPPLRIVFVYGKKVKEQMGIQAGNQTIFEHTACG
ncbi:MAG: hypothetical protein WAN07_10840 [Candidatus Binatus sp.]